MPERKTVGQLMEEMRLKAGAQNYHGHDYMDLERFAEDTRHMIIFDVLMSPQKEQELSYYLDHWDSIEFDDKRKAADGLIISISATSDHVQVEWKI